MSQLTYEDSIYRDQRFIDLIIALGGDRFKALGICAAAWDLAQRWYLKNPSHVVPVDEWEKSKIPNLFIEVGLARKTDAGVYICGTNKHCAFLQQKKQAGQASAAKRKENSVNGRQRVSTSFSVSSSVSDSGSNSNSKNEELNPSDGVKKPTPSDEKKVSLEAAKDLNRKIWAAYEEAYRQRYHVAPTRNATVNGQISNLGKRIGLDAVAVVKFYVAHNDSYYLRDQHPIGLCLAKAESLHTQWKRGRAVLGTEAREMERMQHNSDVWDNAARVVNERVVRNGEV